MCSKLRITLVMVSLLTGCSWLRDQPKEASKIQGQSLDLSCLNDAPTQLQMLFEGSYTASPQDQSEVKAIWTCLDRSLFSFSEYTRGATPGVYTSQELATFANRYLPENKPLTPAFTRAIFRLKQAVLGGSDELLTVEEVKALRKKLTGFGAMIAPLAPHMAILVDIDSRELTHARMIAASALNTFVLNFADLLSDSKNSLNWVDLSAFVSELEKYTRVDKPTALTYVTEQLSIYQYFKLLLVGGDEFAIEKTKWRPIFEAISHFYNALFLANNTVETLDELAIEVESNETEQRVAVEKINGLMRVLKSDENLASHKMVLQLSDRWAKVLILNAVLFPQAQGSLALKPFLGSPGLRKLAGNIADQLLALDGRKLESETVESLAEDLMSFFEQAASSVSNPSQPSQLSLSSLKQYIQSLVSLFEDKKDHEVALLSLDLAESALPVFSGKSSDTYSAKDLRVALQKALDLYLVWDPAKKTDPRAGIGQSFDILLSKPAFTQLKQEDVNKTLQILDRLIKTLGIKLDFQVSELQSWAKNGFKLKSVLFGNTDKSITASEVKTIANLWKPFEQGEDWARSLSQLSNLLRNTTFASANIETLIETLDLFLPQQKQVQSSAFDAELVGLAKAALIGGNSKTLEPKEYAEVAELAAALWRELAPLEKKISKNFEPGLNSLTLEIANAALDGLAKRGKGVEYTKLHPLVMALAKKKSLKLRATTLNKLLIGLNHRMLGRKTTPKPTRVGGSVTPEQISVLQKLIEPVIRDWKELEAVYAGLNVTKTTLPRQTLLKRLKSPDLIHIVKAMLPILDGKDKLIHFDGKAGGEDYYQYDLVYKAFMSRVVRWIFPAYQIEADPLKHTGRLTYNDVVDLLVDINDAILDFGMTYGVTPPPVTATKRMQTINLFTKNGNGDEYLDFDETAEFLTISTGGKNLLDRTLDRLVEECKVPPQTVARQFIPYSCLSKSFSRTQYFNQVYGDIVPEMVRQYNSYNDSDREGFIRSMFNVTDPAWESKTELSYSDFETFLATPYYAENIFERLDANHDQTVNFTEAMAGFPLFCREIKKAGGKSIKGSCEPGKAPRQIEAVFGHLLFFGEPPESIKPGDNLLTKARKAKDFLTWTYRWHRLPRDPALRDHVEPQLGRKELLKIISNLAMSLELPEVNDPAQP